MSLPFEYSLVPGKVELWQHATRLLRFCFCDDDFGIKYFCKDDANYRLDAIGQHFKFTTVWIGQHYCGLKLDWNYD